MNPAFPITPKQAHLALTEMKRGPVRLARPLVVVGGFMDLSNCSMWPSELLGEVSSDTRIVPVFIGFCGSFDECRDKVIAAVERAIPSNDPASTVEVDVIGLSLGGVVARYAGLKSGNSDHRRLKIKRLFTVSSPHRGAKLARAINLCQFHRDLKPGSSFLLALDQATAAADYQLVPYVLLNDEIVGQENAAPPGVNACWLPNPPFWPSHYSALSDERIFADIARRLRGEAPFTHSPAAPLPAS